jgi:hypothetical protein
MAEEENDLSSSGLSRYKRMRINRELAEHEFESFLRSMEYDDEENLDHPVLSAVENNSNPTQVTLKTFVNSFISLIMLMIFHKTNAFSFLDTGPASSGIGTC